MLPRHVPVMHRLFLFSFFCFCYICTISSRVPQSLISVRMAHLRLWYRKSKSLHATSVLFHCALARFLRVAGVAEKHAFISRGFFFLANTTWLDLNRTLICQRAALRNWLICILVSTSRARERERVRGAKDWLSGHTLTFAAASPAGFRFDARFADVGAAVQRGKIVSL